MGNIRAVISGRASHKHVLTGIYLTGVHVMDVYPIGMYLTGYISRRRASYGHTYLMGGYPVVVYLMGVDLSGYLTRHTHCAEWHVVVCYVAPNGSDPSRLVTHIPHSLR